MVKKTEIQGLTKVMRFRVLHHAWECDPYGYVATRPDGTQTIILTTHCWEYEASPEDLAELISEYRKVLEETQAAMTMVGWPIEPAPQPEEGHAD